MNGTINASSTANGNNGGAINIATNTDISAISGTKIISKFGGAATDSGNGGDISITSQGGLNLYGVIIERSHQW